MIEFICKHNIVAAKYKILPERAIVQVRHINDGVSANTFVNMVDYGISDIAEEDDPRTYGLLPWRSHYRCWSFHVLLPDGLLAQIPTISVSDYPDLYWIEHDGQNERLMINARNIYEWASGMRPRMSSTV